MRKLVLLVCMATAIASGPLSSPSAHAGVIPGWEDPSGRFGFTPITNELSFYQNYDDIRTDRGRTLQVVSINSFRLWTDFTFEFTGDFNFDMAPGLDRDHYVELSLVKPVVGCLSLNVQRIISSFEPRSVNQLGLRISL